MKKVRDIEVLIKVPEDWLSKTEFSFLEAFRGRVKPVLKDELMDRVVKKIMKGIKIPKVKITRAEIRRKVLDRIVDKATEKAFEDLD